MDGKKRSSMCRFIGITGGIGSGKSVLSRLLRLNGYQVYDCDYEAKRLMQHNIPVREKIRKTFGSTVFLSNGNINSIALANKIFVNAADRKALEKIVHPAVRKDLTQWVISARNDSHIKFVESAILLSSGIAEDCSEIWIVSAPKEERIRRVKNRNNLSTEEIKRRIESQQNELNLIENLNIPIIRISNNFPDSIWEQIFDGGLLK